MTTLFEAMEQANEILLNGNPAYVEWNFGRVLDSVSLEIFYPSRLLVQVVDQPLVRAGSQYEVKDWLTGLTYRLVFLKTEAIYFEDNS